ncbi:MAG: hypothetical protein ACM3Q4_06845 [Acidobacteriota bacterium]
MRTITLSPSNIQKMLQEYAAIDMLSHQLEKVLDYYEEHPQYPLDFKKLRQAVMEVHARNAEAATMLRSADAEETQQQSA